MVIWGQVSDTLINSTMHDINLETMVIDINAHNPKVAPIVFLEKIF